MALAHRRFIFLALFLVGRSGVGSGLNLMMNVPKLVVFDLDGCVWTPEMFELRGKPSEWCSKTNTVKAGRDRVKLFSGAKLALQELHFDKRFEDTIVACASSTSHRSYAMDCLHMLEASEGVKVADVLTHFEIHPSHKSKHFNNLQAVTRLDFSSMLFFDDCNWGDNCYDVETSCPGVVTVKTPRGLTEELWREGLRKFASRHKA